MTSAQVDKPLKILKPAILPDDVWLFYVIFAIEIIALVFGIIRNSPQTITMSLAFMCIIPGMPIFFHSIFHFTAKFELFEERFAFISYNLFERFLKVSKRQEMAYDEVAYVYYLKREIDFLKKFVHYMNKIQKPIDYDILGMDVDEKILSEIQKSSDETDTNVCKIFLKTQLNLTRYIRTERGPKGTTATARARAYLVLSNKDGSQKAYIANFYDLSGADSQYFLKNLKERNPNIQFLMNPNKIRRLFGLKAK
jgi:hypothetical protein